MRSRFALCSVVALAGTVLAACGDDGPSASPADLDGNSYVVTSIEGATVVDGSEIVISFEDGAILVQAGCNSQRGEYTIEGDTLVVGVLASTMMACEQALMDQDQLMAGIVTGAPTIELDGGELVLATDSTSVTATERG